MLITADDFADKQMYGIVDTNLLPLRRSKSDRSPLVNQLIFGELYEVLEEDEKWLNIRMLHDGTQGWMDRKNYKQVGDDFVSAYLNGELRVTTSLFDLIAKKGDWGRQMLVAGSILPLFNPETGDVGLGDEEYSFTGNTEQGGKIGIRERLIRSAFLYFNAPFVWRCRSPYGIDDTGLVQMAYRMIGIMLPRDFENQLKEGETLSFLEETLPGDLIYFGDESKITHVGIIWDEGRIIHASGRVRIDKIDHHGIFNEESKRYTHALKVIKRIILL